VDGAIKDFLEARGEEYWVYSVTNQVGLLIKGGNKIQPKKKLGFLHIPRTGGTHLERVISQGMGPTSSSTFSVVVVYQNKESMEYLSSRQ